MTGLIIICLILILLVLALCVPETVANVHAGRHQDEIDYDNEVEEELRRKFER